MNNKVEYQISFDIKDDLKRVSNSLAEFVKTMEDASAVSQMFATTLMSNLNMPLANFDLVKKSSSDLQQITNSVGAISQEMQVFQIRVEDLKLGFINLSGSMSAYIALFGSLAPNIDSICNIFDKAIKIIDNYGIIHKIASVAQVAFNQTVALGQRALYVYQMQVLTARAAITTTTGATRAMNVAIAASPYLIAAAAAVTLGGAIYKLATGNSEAARAQKLLDETMSDMNKEVSTEKISLDTLFESLYKAKEGTKEWKQAKDKIQEKYGDYLTQLGIEITDVDTARIAYGKLSVAILDTARARASERALSSAGDTLADKEGKNLTKMRQVLTKEYGEETGGRIFEGIAASIRRGDKEVPERWMKFVRKLNRTIVQSNGIAGTVTSSVSNPITPYIYSMQNARKDYEEEIKRINAVLGTPLQNSNVDTKNVPLKPVTFLNPENPAKGSIAQVKAEFSELEKQLSETPVGTATIDLQIRADGLKKKIEGAEIWIEKEAFKKQYGEIPVSMDFRPVGGNIAGMAERLQSMMKKANLGGKLSMITQEGNGDIKQPESTLPNIEKPLSHIGRWNKAVDEMKEKNTNMIDGLGSMGIAMGNIGDLIGGAAGQWLDWGTNCVQAIAAAIPQIMALCTAQGTQAAANTATAGTGAAAAMASIPIVGPILAVAAVATVLGALASIPKFAAGGLAYGPVLGIFGEYAGAQNNPEVVAPLSRLRSMLQPVGNMDGKVEFIIDGRVLRGILNKVDKVNQRTR